VRIKLAILVMSLLALARPARADDGKVIALLPLAADKKLQIYGQPVASEVARALEQDGFSITVVSSTAPVPSKARLVIDGRIVRGDGDTVLIEARVRDPAIGKIVAEVSATAPTLTRIDEAAAALAQQLAAVLRDGIAAQDEAARPKPRVDPEPVEGDPTPAPAVKVDGRPIALVAVRSAVSRGQDDPELIPLLRVGAGRLAGLIGHQASEVSEPPTAADTPATLITGKAKLLVVIDLLAISYGEGGVITARARARVRVADASGVVFERTVRTATLVGGRGDRRDAVARAAIDQLVDIAMPRVREKLAARKEAP